VPPAHELFHELAADEPGGTGHEVPRHAPKILDASASRWVHYSDRVQL
jgi:hypothetical protein